MSDSTDSQTSTEVTDASTDDTTYQYIIYGVAGAVVLYVFACIWLRGGFHWYSASKKTNIGQKRCYRCGHGIFGISRADPVKDAPGRFQHDLKSDSDNCGNRWYSKLILLDADRYHGGQETWASSLTCGCCDGRGDVERGEK